VNWELLDWSIIGPALAAGLLVLSTHVPLGREVLRRGIIFIDLAIAQVAGMGVIAADGMGQETNGWKVQIAAVTAALFAAAVLNWTEKQWPRRQEALIGILFVLAATGGILLLANNPHGGEHLKDLLVGQILWSTWSSLIPLAVLSMVLLLVWLPNRERLGQLGFYITFAFAVTASVQVVGVYLVFACLIIPALSTIAVKGLTGVWIGYVIGGVSFLLGIILSALYDLPTGAVIVWTMACCALIAGFILARYYHENSKS